MTQIRIKDFVDPLQPFLAYQGFVVLDGGLATELEKHGADLKHLLWSSKLLIENPQLIQKVHEDYIQSGADIITGCSYQATFQGFEKEGINFNEARKLFERSIKLAHQAVNNVWSKMKDDIDDGGTSVCEKKHRLKPLVAASIGPYGCFDGSEFEGNYGKTVVELMDFHRPRVAALLGGNPDLLLFETFPCASEELSAIAKLLQEDEFANVPTIISFSCKDGKRTCCGESFAEGIKIAHSIPHVVAAGVNCTSPLYISELIGSVATDASKPLIVYPNSGETWDKENRCWIHDAEKGFANQVGDWYSKGARIFGGCCRTTPEDIKQIRKSLRVITSPQPISSTKESYRKIELRESADLRK